MFSIKETSGFLLSKGEMIMPTMKESLSQRLNQDLAKIQPNEIRAFDAKVSAMPDMIKLTLGEPDFDVPEVAKNCSH